VGLSDEDSDTESIREHTKIEPVLETKQLNTKVQTAKSFQFPLTKIEYCSKAHVEEILEFRH